MARDESLIVPPPNRVLIESLGQVCWDMVVNVQWNRIIILLYPTFLIQAREIYSSAADDMSDIKQPLVISAFVPWRPLLKKGSASN